jgi:1,2-diacylglycerol 3-alpha-glucosyltransferase
MRIGFFSGVYFPRKDGACYTIKTWKRELEKRGHEVYVIYPGVEGYEPEENEIPVTSLPDPWYEGHRWPTPIGTRKFPELDIVHCHSPGALGLLGRYYAWRKGIPSVFSFHSPLEDYADGLFPSKILSRVLQQVFVRIDERYLKTFDIVTTNTGAIKNREVPVEEVPAGIDIEFFRPTETSFIEEMGLERPVAGYSGRLSEEKNIEEILAMAEDFEGSVLIVGSGRHGEELKKKSGENVAFHDYLPREKLPEFYSSIDVFVHASTGDTFSLSSLEANACGTPVVAPDVHPFDKVVQSGNGLKHQFGDTEDFLGKVREAVSRQWSARKEAEKYSVKTSVEKLEGIYRGLR